MRRELKAKKYLKRRVKLICSSTAIVIFAFNFKICEFFYHNDLTSWWFLKSDLLAISFCLALLASRVRTSGMTRIVISLGVGWSISDVIDRVCFNVRYFTWVDMVMIVLTIIYASYEYYKYRNK